MGTKYSGESISGYDATPPSDDGTVSEANKVKYSTIKSKLAGPVKTLAEAIDTSLSTHFNNGPVATATNLTLLASHYGQVIEASGATTTLTLSDANTLTAGWYCEVRNTGSSAVTITGATTADTFNGTAFSSSTYSLKVGEAFKIVVNAAANGFIATSHNWKTNEIKGGTLTMSSKSIYEAEGANVASASDCNIWVGDGNTVHVTGTTQIDDWGTAPQAGATMRVIFDGALVLNYDATTNDLPGDADITTAANDSCIVYARSASSYQIFDYVRADGTSVWAPTAAQGASMVFLESLSVASSPSTFTTAIDTTYDIYKIEIMDLKQGNNANYIALEISTGASFKTGAADYGYAVGGVLAGTGTWQESNASTDKIYLSGAALMTNDTTFAAGYSITMYAPAGTALYKYFTWSGAQQEAGSSGNIRSVSGSGLYRGAITAIDAIRLVNGGGTISGTAYLYGIKKS